MVLNPDPAILYNFMPGRDPVDENELVCLNREANSARTPGVQGISQFIT